MTIRIERIVSGGFGIGFANRRAVLVPGTAPGDLVEVLPGESGPRSRLLRIVEPGTGRQAPLCPHYDACGGCDLMHLTYETQLEAKRTIVLDVMKRIGKTDANDLLQVTANPRPFGSRIRATWRPTQLGGAGYLARGTHETVSIDRCLILDPALELRRADLRITEAVTGLSNGRQVSLTEKGSESEITFDVGGAQLTTSAGAFFQANGALLGAFVAHVLGEAQPKPGMTIWDLYAGIGLFSIPLANAGARVVSVESDVIASAFAGRNAQKVKRGSVQIVNATVEAFLAQDQSVPDVVVVDPPRTGLSSRASNMLVKSLPRRVVSVSCDPATFARDHRILADAGYAMTSLTAFDLYPQTHHVELVGTYAGGR